MTEDYTVVGTVVTKEDYKKLDELCKGDITGVFAAIVKNILSGELEITENDT